MGKLNDLSITIGRDNKAEIVFDSLFPNFLEVEYKKPNEYIQKYWNAFLLHPERNNNLNGKVFEYILATLCVREGILPIYMSAKVAFVPNVIYDLMFYTNERGPICWSVKTSLRERYKQADLEAIALKYVHRKALSYLVTLETNEAKRDSAFAKMRADGLFATDRMFIGKTFKDELGLFIRDAMGKPRIRLYVNKDNKPVIEFLDEKGKSIPVQMQ